MLQGGMRRKSAGFLLLTLLILVIIVTMAHNKLSHMVLPITKVQVIAPVRYVTEEEVQTILMKNGIDQIGFFYINMQKIKTALQENHWISQVNVSRIWPDTIRIVFNEDKPLAFWDQNSVVTRHSCELMPITAQVKAGLKLEMEELKMNEMPSLLGDEKNLQKLCDTLENLQKSIRPIDIGIKKLAMSKRGSWYLELSNDLIVLLGNKDILSRVSKLISFYPNIEKLQNLNGDTSDHVRDAGSVIRYVDLRYNNGFAVGSDTRERLIQKMESS
jgi:cell division protein FtsQ